MPVPPVPTAAMTSFVGSAMLGMRVDDIDQMGYVFAWLVSTKNESVSCGSVSAFVTSNLPLTGIDVNVLLLMDIELIANTFGALIKYVD